MLPQGSGRVCIKGKSRFPCKNSRAMLGLIEKFSNYIQKAGIAFTAQHAAGNPAVPTETFRNYFSGPIASCS